MIQNSTSGCTLTSSALDASDAARVAEVIARVPGWNGRAHVIGTLSGGLTNRNYLVDVDGARFVVRFPGADTELLEIDRACEHLAATRAADLGFAPPVLGLFDGCLVTRFMIGASLTPADASNAPVLNIIASMLRAFHATAPLPHPFDCFRIPALHRAAAVSRGVAIPAEYERVRDVVAEIAIAFAASPESAVPCHNDLAGANFLRNGPQLSLLDWEYAGMNDRAFDLGNFAVMNALAPDAETHLVVAYHGRVTPRALARLRLMKLVSDAREAMWGVVQQGISTIDFDYRAYASEHFDRLVTNATTPAYQRWLSEAAEAPA